MIAPFYGWGSTASRLESHFEEAVYFLPLSSQKLLVLMDEKLNRARSHPVVLNTGPLDLESSALTARPLFHKNYVNLIL